MFPYFYQIVNDVNIELGNICSLYQILFVKPNHDWLRANGKLNPQLFWNDNLNLFKVIIKNLQLDYSILFHCVTHLNQHYLIKKNQEIISSNVKNQRPHFN